MRFEAVRGALSIVVESRGEPLSTVRFERARGAPRALSLRIEDDIVVLTCGPDATVEAQNAIDRDGPHVAGLVLRDGPLTVRIGAGAPADVTTDTPTRWDLEPRHQLPPAQYVSLEDIEEAEWQSVTPTETTRVCAPIEVDISRAKSLRREPGVRTDTGDAPTRIHLLEEEQVNASPSAIAPPERPAPPPSASRPRLRPAVRRFALLAMLAASWMLWFHAYRGRHVRPLAAARSSGAAASSSKATFVTEAPVAVPAESTIGPAGSVAPSSRTSSFVPTSGVTEARAAADALANGAYADALATYEDLASRPGSNGAYAEVVRSLRSRTPRSP